MWFRKMIQMLVLVDCVDPDRVYFVLNECECPAKHLKYISDMFLWAVSVAHQHLICCKHSSDLNEVLIYRISHVLMVFMCEVIFLG